MGLAEQPVGDFDRRGGHTADRGGDQRDPPRNPDAMLLGRQHRVLLVRLLNTELRGFRSRRCDSPLLLAVLPDAVLDLKLRHAAVRSGDLQQDFLLARVERLQPFDDDGKVGVS